MPTLYVENVPKPLYEALRARAKESRKSIAAEVLSLLETSIPTGAERKRRQQVFRDLMRLQSRKAAVSGPFPPAEEMVRQDRQR